MQRESRGSAPDEEGTPDPVSRDIGTAAHRARLDSDLGRTSGQLLDILISRQDWDGARLYLERLQATNPAAARPKLIEVLLAQGEATTAEEAQLALYQRVLGIDAGNVGASAGIERIKKARRERARRDVPEVEVAGLARSLPEPPQAAGVSVAPPQIEVREPEVEAALRRAREAEQKARAAVEAQMSALSAERERLIAEARASSAERERLSSMLDIVTEERERLSADLEVARTSYAGPPPPATRRRPSLAEMDPWQARRTRRTRARIAGAALAGAAALAAVFAAQPVGIEVSAASATLLDKGETFQASATRTLRLGIHRPATVSWSSVDSQVATVDAQGLITPVGTGRTRVEASLGALTSSVEVTVSLPARIAITPGEVTLTPDGPEAAVEASVLDGSGAPWKKGVELAWTSSDPAVATFAGGKVIRHGRGEAVIGASLGELRASVAVHSLDRKSALVEACQKGGLDACVDLGRLAEKGEEGPADVALALRLYEQACKGGAMKGCVAAGEYAENGREGAPDVGAALTAYRTACEGKWAPGCTRLGRLYEATIRDYGKALPSYRAACDAQDLEGCWRLGTMYELGSGIPRDTVMAAELEQKACDGGTVPACYSLANMRWNGSGSVARDVPRAIALFEKACEGQHGEACLFLALKYKAGEGVVENPRKALLYFGKACAAGHKGACAVAPRASEP